MAFLPTKQNSQKVWDDFENGILVYFKEIERGIYKIYSINRKKAVVLSIILVVIFLLSCLISWRLFFTNSLSGTNQSLSSTSQNDRIKASELTGTGNDNNAAVSEYINNNFVIIESLVNTFKPLLDGFVSRTPDITGITENPINFSYGHMSPAQVYSNKLLGVAFPFITILLSWQVIALLNIEEEQRKRDTIPSILRRLLVTVLILALTPYILSLTINLTNAVNEYIMGDSKITSYLQTFFDKVKEAYKPDDSDWLKSFFTKVYSAINPVEALKNGLITILVLTPIYINLILFLFIIFQFVIRFIKLYFLAIIYPFVMIFYLNKGSNIPNAYWKEWTTSLIHQTGFILGYKVLNDLVFEILNSKGIGLEQLLIYIGSLLFLLSVNIFTAQIWGNAFSAISDSFLAKTMGNFITKPVGFATGAVAGFAGGALGASSGEKTSHFAGKTFKELIVKKPDINPNTKNTANSTLQSINKGNTSKQKTTGFNIPQNKPIDENVNNKLDKHILKDSTKSFNSQELVSKGYKIEPKDSQQGIINIQGNWVGYDNENGITSLYQNRNEAMDDSIKDPSSLYPINQSNINLLDTSNYSGLENYSRIHNFEKLSRNTTNQQAFKTLKELEKPNHEEGVDGIITSQFPRSTLEKYQGRPPKNSARISKGFVYTNKIKQAPTNKV